MIMRIWVSLLAMIFGIAPTAVFGQLHLITGAPTPQDTRSFDSALFRVGEDATVKLITNLVPSGIGTEWIAVAYDLRKAVILPRDSQKPLTVIDLDKAAVVKECVLPRIKDTSLVEEWVANVPGRGPMFEWYLVRTMEESWVQGMILDPAVSCEESFPTVAPYDVAYIVAHGTSGVAEVGSAEGTIGGFDRDGKVATLLAQTRVIFPFDELPAPMRKDPGFSWIIINDSRAFVLGAESPSHEHTRALVFRKSDRTWHVMNPPGGAVSNLRGFGRFISIVEARTKQAVATQRASGNIHITEEVRIKEQSAGRSEWRKTDGRMGPDMEEAFASAISVFPGRLHLYDVDTERFFTIATNQGDSEVLLVENNTVYYRVSDRLYAAPITDKGIGPARLLATSEVIRDAHWAFIKH
jgi:hypothetical protein